MKILFTCPEYGCDQSISVEAHLDMVSTRKGERWEGMAECSMCGKEYRFRVFTEAGVDPYNICSTRLGP